MKNRKKILMQARKEIPSKSPGLHRKLAKQYPTSRITNKNFQMASRITLEGKRLSYKKIFLKMKCRILWLILKKANRCSEPNC